MQTAPSEPMDTAMRIAIAPLAFALCIATFPIRAADPATLAPHFQPLAYLVGHCWRAPFADGKQRDLQCFESLYSGKLVGNSHISCGAQDPLYEGQTIFFRTRPTGASASITSPALARSARAISSPTRTAR